MDNIPSYKDVQNAVTLIENYGKAVAQKYYHSPDANVSDETIQGIREFRNIANQVYHIGGKMNEYKKAFNEVPEIATKLEEQDKKSEMFLRTMDALEKGVKGK